MSSEVDEATSLSGPRQVIRLDDPHIVAAVSLHARLSFASADPRVAVRWNAEAVGDRRIASVAGDDPFAAFDEIEKASHVARVDGDRQRWAGYVGYELNRSIESLPAIRGADDALPNVAFWKLAGHAGDDAPDVSDAKSGTVRSRSMSRPVYLATVCRALAYIAAGDVFQVNLAQSFTVATDRSPDAIWHALQRDSPAVYGARIAFGDTAILSNSPELFFRIEPLADGRRRITTRPIKGTRPRGPGMRDALERSAKDRAELAMIVDLERNDLGRICEIGSVRVVEPRIIEEHPTLYHGVATIDGLLRRDVTLADVFRAMFPCGSITGCPKVRAMEIIDELELEPRGPYCGAIGHVDSDGSAEFSVAIRTMTIRDGIARVSVGGGVVADSDPADEHRETIVKSRAMLRALGVGDADIDALDAP